jgi:hypothetical protein
MNQENNGTTNHASLERISLELVGTTEKASRRVRYVLMVIVTASIVAFSGFWNALNFGWKNSRLELLSTLSYSLNKDSNLYYKIMEGNKDSRERYIDNEFVKQINDGSIKDIGRFLTDLKNAIIYYRPETLGEVGTEGLLKNYRSLEEECVKTIKIPFFNISFDINDLGPIGGFSFFILLLILYYSLKREYENLNTVHTFIFKNFNEEDRSNYYYLISMSQVLSSPQLPIVEMKASSNPKISKESVIKKLSNIFHKHFSKALYFLPFVLLLMIFIYDYCTMDIGININDFNTQLTVWGELAFTVLILICTLMCIFFAVKLDNKWNEIRTEVESAIKKQIGWMTSRGDDCPGK